MAYSYANRRSSSRTLGAPARKMGTWKLAYADFLTALMAFFLVMWMVSNDQESRAGVAEYFSGGERVVAEPVASTPSPAEVLAARLANEPMLDGYRQNIAITAAAETVRLDLYDTYDRPLFASGDGTLNATGTALATAAGRLIAENGWNISLEGHTDSLASTRPGYSNWELSADRAGAARRALSETGVQDQQLLAVSGLADTIPLKPDQPHLPANRRISIVIHVTD